MNKQKAAPGKQASAKKQKKKKEVPVVKEPYELLMESLPGDAWVAQQDILEEVLDHIFKEIRDHELEVKKTFYGMKFTVATLKLGVIPETYIKDTKEDDAFLEEDFEPVSPTSNSW